MRKGQMFILGAVIIIVALVMFRNLLGVFNTIEEKRFQELVVIGSQIRNMQNEYSYITGISGMNEYNFTYFSNFSDFIRLDYDARILYSVSYYNTSSNTYTVHVGNYLKNTINITVNVTDSTAKGINTKISDKSNFTYAFSPSISNGIINITLNYTALKATNLDVFPIKISTRNYTAGFFDIMLIGDATLRSKHLYNRTL